MNKIIITLNSINFIKSIFVLIGGFLGWFLGGYDGFIYALVALVVIDYLTGVTLAILNKNLSSEIGFKGLFRKVLIFALVGVANVVDMYLMKDGNIIRTAVIFFYIANEGISVLENTSKTGLPIPEVLKNVLENYKSSRKNK